MYWLAKLALVTAAGCGRLGFDTDIADSAAAPDARGSADIDAVVRIGPCKASVPIADPVVAAGTIVEVPAFGSPMPEAGVTIDVSESIGGTPFATTTSAADGSYSLALTSQGQPLSAFVTLHETNMLTSVFVPDGPLDGDVIDMFSPITTSSAVSSLYLAFGTTRSSNAGTLLVIVTDCAGAPVTDAVVAVAPAPAKMVYTDDQGSPSAGQSATGAMGLVYALNAGPGPVTVTASKAGAMFFAHEVEILTGDYVMGTRLRVAR